jgi:adenine specific DNA methylase Mod
LKKINNQSENLKRKEYLNTEKKRFTLALNLLKCLGDIIPAAQGA